MKKHRESFRPLVPVLLATIACAPPAEAQPGNAVHEEVDLRTEVGRLNGTLEKIAGLLEKQLEGQTLDLLMKRIQLNADRVSRLEGELRSARADRENLDEQKHQLDLQLGRIELQLESGSMEASEAEFEAFSSQMASEMERVESRTREADRRIAELDARLGSQRADLQEWQDFLDKRLGEL